MKSLDERLRIFVSSTIGECATERNVASRAIVSLNHEPILFELVGARPHPPREVYSKRIDSSHVFIGIYRDSYGWIAPDMTISGTEDEWRLSGRNGLDRLLYVHEGHRERDQRLAELIEEMKNSGTTLFFYSDPEDLYERIRDDVTAVVSERFANTTFLQDTTHRGPQGVLTGIFPEEGHRIRRPTLEARLTEQLSENEYVVVEAAMGFGKTVVLAQAAADHEWVYFDAKGLTAQESVAQSANLLRLREGYPALPSLGATEATDSLRAVWDRLGSVTLVVDALEDPDSIYEALDGRTRLGPNKRLLVAARGVGTKYPQARFTIPALNREEISALVLALRGSAPEPQELDSLVQYSGGNPLYLRYYALGQQSEVEADLQDLEIRQWSALDPLAREALSYLSLVERPLEVDDLKALLGAEGISAGELAYALDRASYMLRRSGSHLELIHEHLRGSIFSALRGVPERLSFYTARLADYLRARKDFVTAFLLLDRFGEQDAAEALVDAAAYQAVRAGGGVRAAHLHRRRAEIARRNLDTDREVESLLNLALTSQQIGDLTTARATLERARSALQGANNNEWAQQLEETELSIALIGQGAPDLIERLKRLRESYLSQQDTLDAARVSVTLSMVYVDSAEFALAAEEAKAALTVFEEIGDTYGARTAKFNLASAYSGLPSHEEKGIALARELEQDASAERSRRERLLLCNIYTRRHREAGNTKLAADFAYEAIQIGESLGDRRTVAINRINLGNVYRQDGNLDAALDEYRAADRAAQQGGLGRIEAAANELIASIHNEREEWALAKVHAGHAAGLLRGSSDSRTLARALEEKATALEGEGDIEAAGAYVEAACAAMVAGDSHEYAVNLLWRALALDAERGSRAILYDLAEFLGESVALDDTISQQLGALVKLLPTLAKRLYAPELIPIVALAADGMLANGPPRLVHHALVKIADEVIAQAEELGPAAVGAIVGSLVAVAPPSQFNLAQLTRLAEEMSRRLVGVSYKPNLDGSSHWTLRLPFASTVICTINELDDSVEMTVTSFVVTAWFLALAEDLQQQVLKVERLPRTEVQVQLASLAEARQYIGEFVASVELGADEVAVVTEATNLETEQPPPIFAICYDQVAARWEAATSAVSSYHLLFGMLAERLIVHLMRGRLERESMRPKLVGVMRRTASRIHASSENVANGE